MRQLDRYPLHFDVSISLKSHGFCGTKLIHGNCLAEFGASELHSVSRPGIRRPSPAVRP